MVSDFIMEGYGYLCTCNNFSVLGVNYCWYPYTFEVYTGTNMQLKKNYEITAWSQPSQECV